MISQVSYRSINLVSTDGSIAITELASGDTDIEVAGGGGGTPSAPDTSVQFNNAGAFGGSSNFTYVTGTNTLTVGNLVSANFTSAAQGLVPASGGGTSNFLRADGTFAAPPATAPAGSDTQIQFNNAGAFGASANFTYNTGTNTFTVGPAGTTATVIETLAPTGSTVAGTLQIRGKNASATNGIGGGITLSTGNGTGTSRGGNFVLTTGTGVSNLGIGGSITMTSGSGRVGGALNLVSGVGSLTNGGAFTLFSGDGNVNGGAFTLSSGDGSSQGGSYLLSAGAGGATGGSIIIASGSTFAGSSGNINISAGQGGTANGLMTLQQGAVLLEYSGGGDDPYAYKIGFYGNAPISKPTITGSRATGAALQDLLTQLASLGLITDSTTA